VIIGDEATVATAAMNSLVVSDVPAGHTAIGVPARILPRFEVQEFRKDNITKTSAESKYDWDYFKLVSTIKPEDAFRPLDKGGCPFVKA